MRLLNSRVARARTAALVVLALWVPSGEVKAAPSSSSKSEPLELEIGQAAYVEARVYFKVEACTDKPYCTALYELFDLFFNDGDECREKWAPVPLPVTECSFRAKSGVKLGPFEARKGVFVAPVSGELSCGLPTNQYRGWAEMAESEAIKAGFQCRGEVVPVPYDDETVLTPRSQ